MMLAVTALVAGAACTPKVAIEPPNRPIAINLNIKLDAEVRVRLEEKAKRDVKEDVAFSVDSMSATASGGLTRSLGRTAAGTIGERYDGYVMARDASPSAATESAVARINAQRRAIYEERAKQENVPVAAVAAIYAGEIVQTAPTGTYFLEGNGKWTRL